MSVFDPNAPVRDPGRNFEAEPYPLRFHSGSAPGVSFGVKGPGIGETDPNLPMEAAMVRWRRVAVRTGRAGANRDDPWTYRFFVLELDEKAPEQRIDFHGFYVRGQFRIVQKENNARRALEAWRAFEPEAR